MKKIIYILFLLLTTLTVCLAFTGCEKETETSSNASTEITGTNSGTDLQGGETGVSSEKNTKAEKQYAALVGKNKTLDKLLSTKISFEGKNIELLKPLGTWLGADSVGESILLPVGEEPFGQLDNYNERINSSIYSVNDAFDLFIVNDTADRILELDAPVLCTLFNHFKDAEINGKPITDYTYEDIVKMYGVPKIGSKNAEKTFEKASKGDYPDGYEGMANEKRGRVSLVYNFPFDKPVKISSGLEVTNAKFIFTFIDREFNEEFERAFEEAIARGYDEVGDISIGEDYEIDYSHNHMEHVAIEFFANYGPNLEATYSGSGHMNLY